MRLEEFSKLSPAKIRGQSLKAMLVVMIKEHLPLHTDLITIRDKLYAHSDATITVIGGNLHFGELRYYRYKYPLEVGYFIDRLHIAPEFFSKSMATLAERMTEKTQYYVDKLSLKFAHYLPHRDGEFLLNIKDQNADFFTQVEPIRQRKG